MAGSRYAYVFGGKGAGGNYLNEILKLDTTIPAFVGWGTCATPTLPVGISFSSAAWDGQQQVAYIFGGEQAGVPPTNSPRNYYNVHKFDPADPDCPGVQLVGILPCPPWDPCGSDEQTSVRPGPGTVAVYAGGSTILVAGGRHLYDPVLGGTFADSRYIYSLSTVLNTFSLQFVDLPACKSHGSGVWHVPTVGSGRFYYFVGYKDSASACEGGGDQVIRYDPKTH